MCPSIVCLVRVFIWLRIFSLFGLFFSDMVASSSRPSVLMKVLSKSMRKYCILFYFSCMIALFTIVFKLELRVVF